MVKTGNGFIVSCFKGFWLWQEARGLCKEVIQLIKLPELKNDFRLRDQIRGSSGSVMDNIAEGFERDGNIEFRQFLSIAKASAGESRSQLYRIYDSGYISLDEMERLTSNYENLSKRIASFISYLSKKNYKGLKFKENKTI